MPQDKQKQEKGFLTMNIDDPHKEIQNAHKYVTKIGWAFFILAIIGGSALVLFGGDILLLVINGAISAGVGVFFVVYGKKVGHYSSDFAAARKANVVLMVGALILLLFEIAMVPFSPLVTVGIPGILATIALGQALRARQGFEELANEED